MSGKRWHAPSASPTPWDGTCDADLTPSQVAVRDSHRSACELRHRTLSETGDASFLDRHVRGRCPRCGDERVCRWGREADGARRHGRGACGRTLAPPTGTILEGHKLPVADWAESVGQAFGPEGLEAMTREDRRSGATTAWRVARPLAVPRGTRDGVMLSGEVRIDERTRPLAAKDRVGGVAGMGAYPGDRICIAVGCDDAGRSLVARAGLGKPGKSRCWDAYGGHIERGPGPVHDMENAHSILVDRLGPGAWHAGRRTPGVSTMSTTRSAASTTCTSLWGSLCGATQASGETASTIGPTCSRSSSTHLPTAWRGWQWCPVGQRPSPFRCHTEATMRETAAQNRG